MKEYIKKVENTTKIKTIIKENVDAKIKYLCHKIPNLEWSGILFYKLIGTIEDSENLIIECVDLLPLDKGTTTFTSIDFEKEDVVSEFTNYVMKNAHLEGCGYGAIHSHHSMASFFSSTDSETLEQSTLDFDIYLSLIVNNSGQRIAKLGHCIYTTGLRAKNEKGNFYDLDSNKNYKIFNSFDCEIITEGYELEKSFLDKVEELCKIPNTSYVNTYNRFQKPNYISQTTKDLNNLVYQSSLFENENFLQEDEEVSVFDDIIDNADDFTLFLLNQSVKDFNSKSIIDFFYYINRKSIEISSICDKIIKDLDFNIVDYFGRGCADYVNQKDFILDCIIDVLQEKVSYSHYETFKTKLDELIVKLKIYKNSLNGNRINKSKI